MKAINVLFISCFLTGSLHTLAQDYPLLTEHPGAFKLIDWGVYTHYSCGYTKTETTINYQKIKALTEVVRRNPVFINQKGFDCETYVYAKNCPDKNGYGIPSELSFGFCGYYSNKGKVSISRIEPPSWKVKVNDLNSFTGRSYGQGASKPTEPTKPGFDFARWNAVNDRLSECFSFPGPREVLDNGIDRYSSELIVVYNPDRPPYFLPVTFRELAENTIAYWKLHPYKEEAELALKMVEDEYARIPESERDGWAYNNTYDPRIALLGVTPIPGPQPVVRINPAYWNRKLPRSSIQFLTFYRLADTQRYARETAEALKHQSTGYHLSRFLEALDITLFRDVIER